MCFGSKKDNAQEDLPAPRPAQATFASSSNPKSSRIPVSEPVSPMSPVASAFPQQRPHSEMAELDVPPPGPPPSHGQTADDYAAPSGPPPSHRLHTDNVAPPPGPPPSHARDEFAPPPGPPPTKRQEDDYIAPPPGPPPSSKPEHDWETLVPDTSLFPPPPDLFSGFERSPTSNATEAEAEAGEQWCRAHPLCPPSELEAAVLEGRKTGSIRLIAPEGAVFRGKIDWVGQGIWKGKTDKKCGDTCLIAFPPLYAVRADSPLASGTGKKTIYYEVRVGHDNPQEVGLALGYAALPYPNNRMPGWHRGSLAVHGDDGHKYINDRWGGKTFTQPMKRGETYGIGMTFAAQAGGRIETDIFYTRQGQEVGRWNLHEETDAKEDLPVTGLEGYHDLSCAVGTYQETSFEVIFNPSRWLYRGA